MLLEPQDRKLFFTLYPALMAFVNERLNVIPGTPFAPAEFGSVAPLLRLEIRDAWLAQPDLLDAFCEENRARFSGEELDLVRSWRHFVPGQFFVLRQMAKQTVFLSSATPAIAYGVLGLTQPMGEVVGCPPPFMLDAVLLPFKGRIVCDGLIRFSRVSFGSGIRASLNENFRQAKARCGLVTALPLSEHPPKPPKKAPVPKPPAPPQKKDEALSAVVELLEAFCQAHLNAEYALVCRKMAEKLGRKRPSPLLHGKPNAWASGIVRAVGGVNFLHDKSQPLYMRATDIDRHLGTSPSNGAARLAEIRHLLKITPLDSTWTLPSELDKNPMVWMLEINGLLMDVRHAPREVQALAFNKGLIPYIPADRPKPN